jgi:hypothetical protein
MTTQPQPQLQPKPDWTAVLEKNRQNISYGLIGLGGALVIASAILWWRNGWESAALIVSFVLFGLTALGAGLWFQTAATGGLSGKDAARLLVLILGGVLGFAVTLGAAWQTVLWWHYVGGGPEVWQAEGGWRIWLLAGLFLVGLALMFASLLLGRNEESDSPILRRLLYGYNAVFTGLLLLGILAAINVLAYLYLPVSSDWTEAGIYTLADKSQSLLKNLKQPVTIYVIEVQRGDRFDIGMRDLMGNARALTDKIQAEYVIRDINRDEMNRLKELYKPEGEQGVIVVYGPGDNAPHTFIPMSDIQAPPPINPQTGMPMRGAPPSPFRGEDRIMSAIATLDEGKKPVVYFTQGNGELDLFGSVQGLPNNRRGQALRDALQRRDNYEVKGLLLGEEGAAAGLDPQIVVAKAVPEDAAAVIVAGPTKPLSQTTIDAIKKYMREPHKEKDPVNPDKDRVRKGKLMVLAGVVDGPGNRMLPLNLDKLVDEYEVEVTNERVLRVLKGDPNPQNDIAVAPNPRLVGQNPLATLFEGRPVPMNNVRVIRPRSSARPEGPAPYQAVELLGTISPVFQGSPVMAESDLGPPAKVIEDFFKKPRAEREGRLMSFLPVAVSVSESATPDFANFHAPTQGQGAPRVEVFGDAGFVSNAALAGGDNEEEQAGAVVNYYLFASALAWLRERPGSMGIEPKKRGSYTIRQTANLFNMEVFPLGLMSLTIVGVGLGVWVARRS